MTLRRGEKLSLPKERDSVVTKFDVGGHDGYMIVGRYPNGQIGELFLNMNKQGSTVRGLLDALAIAVSVGLQYGVPLRVFVEKFSHSRFEPSGITSDEEVPQARSVIDYVFRKLALRYLPKEEVESATASPSTLTSPMSPADMRYEDDE